MPDVQNYSSWMIVGSDSQKICNYDSVQSVDANEESAVPTEPIESGQLAAYNKIAHASEVTISIAFDGDYQRQEEALSRLEELRIGTETMDILSPGRIWRNMALQNYSFSRAAGAGGHLLVCDLSLVEIVSVQLESQTVAYTPKNPTSAKKVNTGKAQPVEDESAASDLWGRLNNARSSLI